MLVTKCARYAGDLKKLVLREEANPITIANALDDCTNKEWRGWEIETVQDFVDLPNKAVQQLDKVIAVQVALTNQDIFDNWPLFSHCSTAFNHRRVNFDWMELPSYIEQAWTCTVLRALSAHDFGPVILRYLQGVCVHGGLAFFPWVGGEGLIVDPRLKEIAEQVKSTWDAGSLQKLKPSDVDDSNVIHVQLAKIVNALEYIRSQE